MMVYRMLHLVKASLYWVEEILFDLQVNSAINELIFSY